MFLYGGYVLLLACEYNGVDQGIHNVLVYTGRIPHTLVLSHEAGPVATVGRAPIEVRRDSYGRVLNENGEVAAVVHQYDRSGTLGGQYASQYPWIGPNDRTNRK